MKSFKDTEIGREFLAGKCYLRVSKTEWAEFVKWCEAAGMVSGGTGSKPANFPAIFNPDAFISVENGTKMWQTGRVPKTDQPIHPFSALCAEPEKPAPKFKVGDLWQITKDNPAGSALLTGDIVEIVRLCPNGGSPRVRDGKTGREFWIGDYAMKPLAPTTRKIIITTDGKTTTARLMEGEQTIRTATATCSPSDTFDFDKDARLAFDRLVPRKGDGCLEIEVSCDVKPALDAVQEVHAALDKLAARVERMAAK